MAGMRPSASVLVISSLSIMFSVPSPCLCVGRHQLLYLLVMLILRILVGHSFTSISSEFDANS